MIWRVLTLILALGAAIVAVPAARHWREQPPPPPPPVRATFNAPPDSLLGAGDTTLDAAISPDGRQVVFVATTGGRAQLWHRALDGDRATALPGTEGASMPAWKPGDRVVAFFADGKLRQFSFGDRAVRDLADAPEPGGAAWRADGAILFVPDARGGIKLLRNGTITGVTTPRPGDRAHLFPSGTTEDGFIYLAQRDDGSRVLRLATGDQESELTRTSSHGVIASNTVLYVRDGVLIGQALDLQGRALVGRSSVITADAGVSSTGRGFFAATSRIVLSARAAPANRAFTWLDADGQQQPVLEPGAYWQLQMAPDGRHAAVTAVDPLLRTLDVFVVPMAAPAERTRLSLSIGADSDPVWSPDSARVAFRSQQAGRGTLIQRAIAPRTAPEEPIGGASPGDVPSDWRTATLLVHAPDANGNFDIYAIDLASGQRRQVTASSFNEKDARWSADGRWIAYVSDESGGPEIYVDRWPEGGQRVRVTFAGARRPLWQQGYSLLFMRGDALLSVTGRSTGDRLQFGTPTSAASVPGLIDFSPSRGRGIGVLASAGPQSGMSAEIVLNWENLVDVATFGTRR